MEKSQSLLEEEEFLERPRDMINPLKSPHDSLHPDKNAILHELLPSSDKVHFFSEKLFGNEMTLLCMYIRSFDENLNLIRQRMRTHGSYVHNSRQGRFDTRNQHTKGNLV